MWIGKGRWSGRSPGQVCSDAASSHVNSLRAPAGAQPSPLRASAPGSSGFIFSPVSTCSPTKPSAAASRAGFVGFDFTKQTPTPPFQPPPDLPFFGCKPGCFSRSSYVSSPHVISPPSQRVFWMRSFGLDPIFPMASCFKPGRALGCREGICSSVTRGCSQGYPSPFGGGTRCSPGLRRKLELDYVELLISSGRGGSAE